VIALIIAVSRDGAGQRLGRLANTAHAASYSRSVGWDFSRQ
jgi:hypothetical protein